MVLKLCSKAKNILTVRIASRNTLDMSYVCNTGFLADLKNKLLGPISHKESNINFIEEISF